MYGKGVSFPEENSTGNGTPDKCLHINPMPIKYQSNNPLTRLTASSFF